MKKLAYLYVLFLIFACSKSKEMNKVAYDVAETEISLETFENENMIQQKLQDYYDLITLKEKYPKFNKEINSQLNYLVIDSLQTNANKKVTIKNLEVLKIEVKKPELKHLYLHFDIVVDNNFVKKDSIIAILTTKKVFIDNAEALATKVKFKK